VPARRNSAESVEQAQPNPLSYPVKLVVSEGEKIKEQDAALIFDSGRLVVRSRGSALDLKAFPYSAIRTVAYSYSSHPLYRTSSGPTAIFAIPLFFVKGKKHWLSIRAGEDFGVVRMEKENYTSIISALELRAGLDVEMLGEADSSRLAGRKP
jgi:hypothetical protein